MLYDMQRRDVRDALQKRGGKDVLRYEACSKNSDDSKEAE